MFIATLKVVALQWIDDNCALAWFRAYFTPDPMEELKRMNLSN